MFAALLAAQFMASSQACAQSFSIFPEKKITMTAAPGALVNDQLFFENLTDRVIHIATTHGSDPAIGIDIPDVITLKPHEKCNYVVSYEGGHDASGFITLSEGSVNRRVDIRGSSSAINPGPGEQPSIYQDGNSEITFVVGPNPVVDDMSITLAGATTSNISVADIEGKVIASTIETTYVVKRDDGLTSGTYVITASGITKSGKPFNDTRKVVVE